MNRLNELLEKSSNDFKGKIIQDHIILDIIDEQAHYWSPHLNFRIETDEDNSNHTVVSGLIGPRPEVWTLFMFIYFAIGALGFFISSYGIVKLMLGEYSNYILVIPLTILLMLTAYGVGKYGEKLADDQMEILKQFIRDAISFEKKI